MDWLTDNPALGWLAAALLLGVVELATVDLIFLMLAGGAVAAAVVAALGAPFVVQVLVGVAVALLLVGLVRPVIRRRFYARGGTAAQTGTASLVGRDALVVDTVTTSGGRVKLAGEIWSARVAPRTTPDAFLPGHLVRVLAIDGATAVVAPAGPEPELS